MNPVAPGQADKHAVEHSLRRRLMAARAEVTERAEGARKDCSKKGIAERLKWCFI